MTTEEEWGKEYPLVVPVTRRDLEISGFSQEQIDLLTDEDMQAIVTELRKRYALGFQKELWCAGKIIIKVREKTLPPKNPRAKTVAPEKAYAVYQDGRGEWTYYVLKHYQTEEKAKENPYARYFCFVTSPMCPKGEYGDVYRVTVLEGNHLIDNPLCTDKQTGGQDG